VRWGAAHHPEQVSPPRPRQTGVLETPLAVIHPQPGEAADRGSGDRETVSFGFDQVRSASELLAQRTLERVLDLVVEALDVNELVQQADVNMLLSRLDVNAVLEKVDVNALLSRVDLDALLDRVDVNRLITRVDIDSIAQHTDIGAVVVASSENMASGAVDIVRGQVVAADQRIDRWVHRLLRRKAGGPAGPSTLLKAEAGT
jgi:hypothetical protein